MIHASKLQNAFYALNGLLVMVRAMAYENRPSNQLVEVLDIAEYLPLLLAESADRTTEFRAQLVLLFEKYPDFQIVLERFDRNYLSVY